MSDVLRVLTEEEWKVVNFLYQWEDIQYSQQGKASDIIHRLASRVAKLEAELERIKPKPSTPVYGPDVVTVRVSGSYPVNIRYTPKPDAAPSSVPADVAKVPEGVKITGDDGAITIEVNGSMYHKFSGDNEWVCDPAFVHYKKEPSDKLKAAAYADLIAQMPQAKGESK